MTMKTEDTMPKLLRSNYEKFGNRRVAMLKKDLGVWNEYTWEDYYLNVKWFSLGLISLGLNRGDAVAIIGKNDPQWYWAELAVQAIGGIPVGIYTDSIPAEVKYLTEHSNARFIVAGDQEQIDKYLSILDALTNVENLIYWNYKGLWNYDQPLLMHFSKVVELGKEYESSHPGLFEQNVERGKGEDIAYIAYTSGTTGLPKGAMMSHRSLLATGRLWITRVPTSYGDKYVSAIPPAWCGEQWLGIGLNLYSEGTAAFTENADTSEADMREMMPYLRVGPPVVWERMASYFQAIMMDASWLNSRVYRLFLPIGYRIADSEIMGKRLTPVQRLLGWLANFLCFTPIKDKLGVRKMRVGYVGGGFIAPETFRFLHALGLRLRWGAGLTEGGGYTLHKADDVRFQTTGTPMLDAEVRITDDGEIAIRSSMNFSGYYKEPEMTQTSFISGWVYTGDAGYFLEDGHLIVTGRKAELVELEDGTRFSPMYIEGMLRFSPFIDEAIVTGKSKTYITAMVSINLDNVGRWAEKNNLPYTTFSDISQKVETRQLIGREIAKINRFLPEKLKVRKFVNLHKQLDADEAELTRTRKVRRGYIETHYGDLAEALYRDVTHFEVETEVKYRDGREGRTRAKLAIDKLV